MRFFATIAIVFLLVLAPTMGLAQQTQQPEGTAKKELQFETWRTIKLGTGFHTADFRRAFQAGDFRITNWADIALGNRAFKVSTKEAEVGLVNVSMAELGLKDDTILANFYKRAQELGLELCPNEVGPQLRLQYKDQPKDEWLLIAMKPIAGSYGALGVFAVGRLSVGLYLGGYFGYPDYFWGAAHRWIFVRPRK